MTRIRLAHLRDQGIDFAVFDADARTRANAARAQLLAELTTCARADGLKIDKAALAFREAGRTTFYGTDDLVRYLSNLGGVPRWTHTITV